MGREEGIPAVPPKLAIDSMTLFALTNISLSCNVEITVQTTWGVHLNSSRGNFNGFRSSAAFSGVAAHLWRLLPVYFPLSQPVSDCCNYLQNKFYVKSRFVRAV